MRGYTCSTDCLPNARPTDQHVAQCCRNIKPSFNKCSGIQKVCLGFRRIHRNVNKNYFFISKNSVKNKIMIWGIHYFITVIKTKIDVIPRSRFNAPSLPFEAFSSHLETYPSPFSTSLHMLTYFHCHLTLPCHRSIALSCHPVTF